jgi:hypothetical protein
MNPKNRVFNTLSAAAPLVLAQASLGQAAPVTGDDWPNVDPPIASAETHDLELGPNTGSQPKPPAPAPAPSKQGEAEPPLPSRFHLTLGSDITSAYFFRGLRQETSGFIAQPYADAALDILRLDGATVSLKLGTWNSFHGKATGAATTDSFTKNWYECDLYAGVGLTAGKWAFDARYVFETSPSNAWGTVEEFDLGVAYDDTELLGAWSLKPTVLLGVETGSNAADGGRKGAYLQLGVSPGFTFDVGSVKDIAVTFPVSVGLSLGNYYEGSGGENDVFGFASVGAKASVPLPLDKSWGAWTLSAGVQGLFLGDAARTFNNSRKTEIIGTVGVSVSF